MGYERFRCNSFRATVTNNGSPYAMGPLSVLSVTLVYCDPMDGWINMPLGTEVGLCQGDMVLDGDPAPQRKSSHFSAYVYCGHTIALLSNC